LNSSFSILMAFNAHREAYALKAIKNIFFQNSDQPHSLTKGANNMDISVWKLRGSELHWPHMLLYCLRKFPLDCRMILSKRAGLLRLLSIKKPRRCLKFSLATLFILTLNATVSAATLSVGPGKQFAAPCAAFSAAADGDTIEIDAAGTYEENGCTIKKNRLTIRGINGRPKIYSLHTGPHFGMWTIETTGTVIDNVEMSSARQFAIVLGRIHSLNDPGPELSVRNSYLHDNSAGIAAAHNFGLPSNIVIENCEFARNNVEIGLGYNLAFHGNYVHDAVNTGLVSFANTNAIMYNRFSGSGGASGPAINLPGSFTSYVIGNVIQQPANKSDPTMLAYGVSTNASTSKSGDVDYLYVINNTFLNDDASGGAFVRIGNAVTTPALVQNNMFIGTGTAITQAGAIDRNNYKGLVAPVVNRANFDLHPVGPVVVNAGSLPGRSAAGFDLTPLVQYKHVAGKELRPYTGALSIGAYEPLGVALNPPDSMLDDSKWTWCASEGGTCNFPFPGTARRVRYGLGNLYSVTVLTSATSCNTTSFGDDPVYGWVKSCSYENTPIDLVAGAASVVWTTCAQEGGTCLFSGAHQVRYGANNTFRYKSSGISADGFLCSAAVFGDPLVGVYKHCEYDVVSVRPGPSSSVPTPNFARPVRLAYPAQR
jgi:hypothetical protein